MEEIKSIFAQNLIRLRKQMKITQVEFAEKINYSDKAVSKWERGESIPDVAVLKSISDFFGVTIDFLISAHNEEEVIKQPTNYAKTVKNRNRFLISAITIVAIFVCALTVFVSLQSANHEYLWVNFLGCFVFPLPIYFLLLLIFSSLWAKRIWKIVFVSAFIWSLILVSFCIVWLATSKPYPLVFVVGIPAQVITLMSFGIINLKTNRAKNENSSNSTDAENPE
ncbi:MAG: helix-turn-helix transcriptional regulator [Clostridiales bacterium]|nr:helix-turn-helix transcriptional regulator [Clostridiales bacterium]